MSKNLEAEVKNLKEQQRLMREQLEWLKLLLQVQGVNGPWVSPQVAATAIGRSRDRIILDIQTAEEWRTMLGKSWNLVYGKHYRNDQGMDAKQATWKVNLLEYYEFTLIPPDQLKVA